MNNDRFSFHSEFIFKYGSYTLVEFQKTLEENNIPYISRDTAAPYTLIPEIIFHVPDSYLNETTRIYEKIQFDSLINSELNILREIKNTDKDDASIPSSSVFKDRDIVICVNDSEVVFNDKLYSWKDMLYIDKIEDYSERGEDYSTLHFITSDNTQYKISLLHLEANNFIAAIKIYFYRSNKK